MMYIDELSALAASSSGTGLGRQRQVLAQSEKYPTEKGLAGYSSPSALAHDGKVFLIYNIAAVR
ncbi:MAG: hypothetical protein ACI9B9_000034 [Halioglobus sp.]|jgi:hypothetical protein